MSVCKCDNISTHKSTSPSTFITSRADSTIPNTSATFSDTNSPLCY